MAKTRKLGGLDDRSDFLRLFFSSLGGGPGRIPDRNLYELESKLLRGGVYIGDCIGTTIGLLKESLDYSSYDLTFVKLQLAFMK